MLKQEEMIEVMVAEKVTAESAVKSDEKGVNAIYKGSKIVGNIVISQDLQIDGDIEGNITAENNASIFIKAPARGILRPKAAASRSKGK